jgi:hypothetical protein
MTEKTLPETTHATAIAGPWEWIPSNGYVIRRAVTSGQYVAEIRPTPSDDPAEMQATATLICAAPDLLVSCRDYIAWLNREPDRECVTAIIQNMRAAIAKGEGRS